MASSRSRRYLTGLLALAAFAGLAWGHARALRLGPAHSGPLLVLSHLFTLVAVATLLLLCAALGRLILRRAGIPLDAPLEALPFTTTIGMAAVGTLLLLAGAVGALVPAGLVVTLGACLVVSRSEIPAVVRSLAELPADLRRAVPALDLRSLLAALTILVAAFLLVAAIAPPADWDVLMYHLTIPSEFLHRGRIFLPEANLHASLIGPIHLLYVPLLAVGADSGPAVLSAALALLLSMAVLACGTRLLSPRSGAYGAIALWGSPAFMLVAVTARVDVTTALYAFVGHYALLLAWTERGRRYFLLGAVLLGAAVAVKLQALAYVAALAPMAAWLAWRRPWEPSRNRSGVAFLGTLLGFATVGVGVTLPWLLKNQILLGAPFYPLLAKPVLPPWLADIFGSRTLPPNIDRSMLQVLGNVRERFDVFKAFLSPSSLTVEGEGRFYFVAPLVALLPLTLLDIRRRATRWLLLGGLGYMALLLGYSPRTNLRYLIPGLVPLTLLAAHGLIVGLDRIRVSEGVRSRVAALIVLLSLGPMAWAGLNRLTEAPAITYAIGTTSADAYLARQGNVLDLRRMVSHTPPGSRVLFLFDARAFGMDREVLQDNYVQNWQLLVASGAPERCLAGTGITHVLVAVGVIQYYIARGASPESLRIPALNTFLRDCARVVARTRDVILFRIEPDARTQEGEQRSRDVASASPPRIEPRSRRRDDALL